MIRTYLLLFVVVVMAACTPESPAPADAADVVASGRPHPHEVDNATRTEPASRRSLPDRALHGAGASSWEEQLGALPRDDAQHLRAKNERYFGALAYNTAEERALLGRIGIPLPEDFVAARRLTIQELEEAASGGQLQSELLYIDRLIEDAQLASTSDAGIDGDEALRLAAQASFEIGRIRGLSNSAFIPYLQARLFSSGSMPAPEYVVGAMLAAVDRGDTRALGLLKAYARDYPTVDALMVALVYGTLKSNRAVPP